MMHVSMADRMDAFKEAEIYKKKNMPGSRKFVRGGPTFTTLYYYYHYYYYTEGL